LLDVGDPVFDAFQGDGKAEQVDRAWAACTLNARAVLGQTLSAIA
jgi:hypothetical protein